MRSLTPAEYIRHLSRRCSAVAFFLLSYNLALEGQVLTQNEAIASALQSYPSVQLAEMEVRMQKALEKGAFNPEQPELTFEFPNDVGLVFDLRQSFDFPSVYGARKRWFQAQTDQQAQAAGITRQELIRDVRLAYLDAQVAVARLHILAKQDSLWENMDSISQRLYAGGQINRADELFSAKQAGLVHQFLLDAQVSATNALLTLESYTGNKVSQLDPLSRIPFSMSDTSDQYYFEAFFDAQKGTVEHELKVRKVERLPDIIVGYLRVPEVETVYRNRFNAGLAIPIWQGQYKGAVEHAQIAIDRVQTEAELQKRQAEVMTQRLVQTWMQTGLALDWYESSGLPQTRDLVSAYQRLYSGGEVDYALTLRNIADTLEMHLSYLEMMERHNQAVIGLAYLFGK